ncbi:hypothetical protein E8E11_011576 [Didymella keratinophila]|nr:hypothetical protein E8E11_011576 [Didymella keratinophila]
MVELAPVRRGMVIGLQGLMKIASSVEDVDTAVTTLAMEMVIRASAARLENTVAAEALQIIAEKTVTHGEHSISGALPVGAAVAATLAEKVSERLLGPDGTPFGYLPTKDKGVGFLAHAKTTYQHIKAEQDAGHRSKGSAEKLIHGWLQRSKNAKSAANGTIEGEEVLIEKNTSSRKQANSVRSPTPSVQEVPSRFQSPEPRSHESATAAWSPTTSQHGSQPPPGPTPPPAVATPYPTAPSVVDMSAPVLHIAPPPPPPPPPPPSAPIKRHVVDAGRDALLASIQVGVKLKKVGDADEKDARLACKDEARVEDLTRQATAYEETPHSHDVEALKHAQAVEERERRQEEERVARSKTPFIAPQPRPNMSANLQDELAAKLSKVKLKKADGDVSECAPSVALKVVKPRASNETWLTVFSDQEPYSEPDQAFRERLGGALSARGTTQPPPAVTVPVAAPAREVTPDPDVVVNLSANTAGPGWSFDNVPKNDEA